MKIGSIFSTVCCALVLIACVPVSNPVKDIASLSSLPVCCVTFDGLSYKKLEFDSDINATLSIESQVFPINGKPSFVNAYILPEWDGALQLSLSTGNISQQYSKDNAPGVLRPSVYFLDKNFDVLRKIQANAAEHWFSNYFRLTIFINEINKSEKYVVITSDYSIKERLTKTGFKSAQVGQGVLLVPLTISSAEYTVEYIYSPTGSLSLRLERYAPKSITNTSHL